MVTGSVGFWVQLCLGITAILGTFFMLKNFIAYVLKFIRTGMTLFEALLGTPATEDEPAKPGIRAWMRAVDKRLDNQDATLERQNERLDELKSNGGSSLKDQVSRLEEQSGRMEALLTQLLQERDNERSERTVREGNQSVGVTGT